MCAQHAARSNLSTPRQCGRVWLLALQGPARAYPRLRRAGLRPDALTTPLSRRSAAPLRSLLVADQFRRNEEVQPVIALALGERTAIGVALHEGIVLGER
jgi:hypothetical protein